MKIKKTVCYILMYLPLVIVLIALPYLPEKIPAHYGFDNQVDRWGNKYEALLFPIISLLMGYFLLEWQNWRRSRKNMEKTIKMLQLLWVF